MKKTIFLFIILVCFLSFADNAQAITKAELIQQIAEITELIQQLQQQLAEMIGQEDISGIPSGYVFSTNLKYGASSNEVIYLQIILNQDPDTQVSSTGWWRNCHRSKWDFNNYN